MRKHLRCQMATSLSFGDKGLFWEVSKPEWAPDEGPQCVQTERVGFPHAVLLVAAPGRGMRTG
jgi:hypothetical protein